MQTIMSRLPPLGIFFLHISHMPFKEESKQPSILTHPSWLHMRPFRCASSFIHEERLFWIQIQDHNPDAIVNEPAHSSRSQSYCMRRITKETRITKKNWEGVDAKLTWEAINALAVEHLSSFDLTDGSIFAGVGHTGVVTALTNGCAVQNIAPILLKVVHHVVDIQEADTADQTGGDRGPLLHAKKKKKLILSTLLIFRL